MRDAIGLEHKMSEEHQSDCFHEVDPETAKAALRSGLECLNLTPEELLLGKLDEHGDILWMGHPRWLFKHLGTLPTVDGIIEPDAAAPRQRRTDDSKTRTRPERR